MPNLALSLLGSPQISLDGRPVTGLVYHKSRALLFYLAQEIDRAHAREEIVGLLWPDLPEATARSNLRQVLTDLRRALGGKYSNAPALSLSGDSLQVNAESAFQLDTLQFVRLLAACERHPHRRLGYCQSCAERMERAVELYRGDFLSGFWVSGADPFEEWVALLRERLRRRMLDILAHLAAFHERQRHYPRAQAFVSRLIELDPLNEVACQHRMRLYAYIGQRSAALEEYERCRRVLRDELGVEPVPETKQLQAQIRTGPSLAEPALPAWRLPLPSTSLVGRAAEIAELRELVADPGCRMITVVGPGGIGKTRLALAVAAAEAHTFVDGAAFVSLDGLDTADRMPATILQALGVSLEGNVAPKTQIVSYLRDKEFLLVLDSMEHLLEGTGIVSEILQAAPRSTVLATSRERLNLQSEWLFAVAGLGYPYHEAAGAVSDYEAVQLFTQRAKQTQRNFQLSEQSLAVARICRLVEGLPLAIELAAAACAQQACAHVAVQLEHDITTLAGGTRDLPARQRSIRATQEHSWRLLSESERQMVQRIAIFRGAFDAAAAERVTGATREGLSALADKSWLRPDGLGRHSMHALTRQFARKKLAAAGEEHAVHRAHLEFLCQLADTAHAQIFGAEQERWLTQLADAQDDIHAALRWALDQNEVELALRLSGANARYWEVCGAWREGQRWLQQALELDPATSSSPEADAWRARALMQSGVLTWLLGDFQRARELFEQSLGLYRRLDNPCGSAEVLSYLGNVYHEQGNYAAALPLYQESLAFYRAQENRMGIAALLFLLGLTALNQKAAAAKTFFAESLALRRAIGEPRGISYSLNGVGNVAYIDGDLAAARAYYDEALGLRRKVNDKRGVAANLVYLANVEARQGNYVDAKRLYAESLALQHAVGDQRGSLYSITGLGRVAQAEGHYERAVLLLSAAEALARESGQRPDEPEYTENEQTVAALHRKWDEACFKKAWEKGQTMTIQDAVGYASMHLYG